MHEIENWIRDAVEQQGISIRKLPREAAIQVQREVTARYVKTNSPCTWWWNFSRPVDENYDRNTVRLSDIIPTSNGLCWFIPDTEQEWLPVYELEVSQIEKLIDDCPGFEYYIVAKDFNWLLVETHHDQYYVCRDSDTLSKLAR
jgi:hypothetical protein